MLAVIKRFDSRGDTILKEYDPATADMEEVDRVIREAEKQCGGRAFDLDTNQEVTRATPENRDIAIIGPLAGG